MMLKDEHTNISSDFKDLLNAILNGKDTAVLEILSKVDLRLDDENGISALHYAAEVGNITALKAILECGQINVNKETLQTGSTALMQAAMRGKDEAVGVLLEAGARTDLVSRTGYTALMMAVEANSFACVRLLLPHKCDLNTVNIKAESALTLAADKPEILKLLLETGQVHKNVSTASPLHKAGLCLESAKMLISDGFDVNLLDSEGDSPLGCALINKRNDLVQLFLKNGAETMQVNSHGASIFELAAMYDDSEAFLKGVNCPLQFLEATIVAACMNDRLEIIKLLSRENLDVLESASEEALKTSAEHGANECVRFFLPFEIDKIESLFNSAQSAIASGHMNSFKEIFEYVLENANEDRLEALNNSLPYLLLTAAECDKAEAVQFLLEKGVPVDGDGSEGCTPLIAAAASGSLETIRLLLKYGADVNAEHEMGGTALLLAATNDRLDIVKELLLHGADQSIADGSGFTPLLTATLYNRIDIVNALLENQGSQVNSVSQQGMSPLLAAASIGDDDIATKFLDLGAQMQQRDDQGNSSLHIAAEKGHMKMISFLVHRGFGVEAFWECINSEGDTPLDSIIKTNQMNLLDGILNEFPEITNHLIGPTTVNESQGLCLICRDEFENQPALILPCKHEFHHECFRSWSQLHPKCPTCKRFPYKIAK